MNGRERVLKTLNFKEPDRIPLDFGAAYACGIHIKAYKRLIDYLDITVPEIKIYKMTNQAAQVHEAVLQKIGVDVRAIGIGSSSSWKLKMNEDDKYSWYWDEWGRKMVMPKIKGFYYDMVEFPLKEKNIDDYTWPDPTDPARFIGLKEKAQYIIEQTGSAVVASNCLANGFLQMGAQLYGFSRWLMMLASEPQEVEKFLDQLLEFKTKYWETYLTHVKDVDIVCEADDLGTQRGTWISKKMFRKYIKPRQEKLFKAIKKKADVKIFLHSCGSCYDFIPDLIEAGVDILNPIQVSAAHMDTKELKKEFGSDLVFWGGGVDTQRVLPFGTPQEVKEEVKRRIEDMAPGGGFVFAAVHNIQADVPPPNIVAMFEALDLYGKY